MRNKEKIYIKQKYWYVTFSQSYKIIWFLTSVMFILMDLQCKHHNSESIISMYTLILYACFHKFDIRTLAWKRLKTPALSKQITLKEDGNRVGGERERERAGKVSGPSSSLRGLQNPAGADYSKNTQHYTFSDTLIRVYLI